MIPRPAITPVMPSRARPLAGGRTAAGYRPDIDGLRAIAVLAVVLSHLPGPVLPGGYLGVDIFFVISGYLITGMIRQQMAEGRFSLRVFYGRRARRILPALVVMLLLLAILALAAFRPADRAGFGREALASLGFVYNFYLLQAGAGHGAGLLLHTWSLAIEEQFYLVFPLFCLLAFRTSRRVAVSALALAAGLSFAACVIGMETGRYLTAFLLLPTRGWELALGGLVALAGGGRQHRHLGTAGLCLMILALATGGMVAGKPWPAVLTVCLGAAMIIRAGEHQGGMATAWLATRPMVFIGLISYSLYLWHWPLLAAARTVLERRPTLSEGIACVVLAGVLAALSWRFVEQPTRRGVLRPAALAGLGGALTALLLVLLAAAIRSGG
ncbi:acyltransferase family protein [Tistrella mobilis]|uniref:Acyltransferase 3 n=1 Tax=Tistrella mobilis (strain KA081020-065) TaxID=1110502 RepID=I3TNB7_TISMK|nr:acyltransferase [Tistrella mobilis]AFK54255.1 acyltransferase 3 [Tistrella mobilis KA081020-065]